MSKPGGDPEKDGQSEDNIRVVCRFRPLNDSEEKAGSKFVVKFPSDDGCVSIGVSSEGYVIQKYHQCNMIFSLKNKSLNLILIIFSGENLSI